MVSKAKYACEVVNYFNKQLAVRKEHTVTSQTFRYMAPGTKFSGYELFVEEPGRKVWMRTEDGWVTVLWPNKSQTTSGVGTTKRIKYTEVDPGEPPSASGKVVSVLLTYEDGSTQEFVTQKADFFSLHPFIEAHPEAVFIKRTNVPTKTDAQAKQNTGSEFANEIFVYGTKRGIPLSHKIAIKPNVTYTVGKGNTPEGMGIITDVDFTEGLIEGMKGMGFQSSNMYMREGNWLKDGYCPEDVMYSGYPEMADRAGINSLYFDSGPRITDMTLETLEEGSEVVWKETPDGVVFKRIGYVSPYNQDKSWLLNVAKFKTHFMGMTLCAKNLQGVCVTPHVHFCEGVDATSKRPEHILKDFQPDFVDQVTALHAQHLNVGYPRWDRPGISFNGGYGMETWAQRTCDFLSVTNAGLNVIEGIYGRNGNGFMSGPGPEGKPEDFMTNILIFGKDPIRVDIIGTWLAGHEPGNFGFFHIAKERGLSTVVNPRDIPIYRWDKDNPEGVSLEDFERSPLLTAYLRKDYDGQTEDQYHMVDEPFDYQAF